jgi:hypothetical protein
LPLEIVAAQLADAADRAREARPRPLIAQPLGGLLMPTSCSVMIDSLR